MHTQINIHTFALNIKITVEEECDIFYGGHLLKERKYKP